MKAKNILLLDYSIQRIEAPAIQRWMPADAQVTALFIDTESSFPDNLINNDFTHVIHSGSELSITEKAPFTKKAVRAIKKFRDQGISQMGICYGHQLVCKALVGDDAVRSSPNGFEAGWRKVAFNDRGQHIFGVRESEVVWQHHFDEVTALPKGSELLATNEHTNIQAYINFDQHLLGTQFHPEFDQDSGNELYLRDRKLLETHGYMVDEIVKSGPSVQAGKIFFETFFAAAAR